MRCNAARRQQAVLRRNLPACGLLLMHKPRVVDELAQREDRRENFGRVLDLRHTGAM
jgi:hypothetical protein